jgi:hypothetical protein
MRRVVSAISLQLASAACNETASGPQSGSSTWGDAGTATFASTTMTDSSTGIADDSTNESSGPAAPVCGDGIVELNEQCDDRDPRSAS